MRLWLLLLFLFVCPAYASEPAVDTLPPELVRLRDDGRLTVRALWAWKLVPASTATTAMEMRTMGLDLIGADRAQLAAWVREAEEGTAAFSPAQREVLSGLLAMMDSGSAAVSADMRPTDVSAAAAPPVPDAVDAVPAAPAASDTTDAVPPVPAEGDAAPQLPDAADAASSVPDVASGAAMYRGGAARTGVSETAGPAGPAAELWKLKVGDGQCTAPVVFDGLACFGSVDGHLYAVDVATGALKWKFFAQDWVEQPPAMAGGTVFFGNAVGDGSGDRHLFALDAARGGEKWRFKSQYYGVNSSPAIVNGTVYFGAGDHRLYALDAQTGEKKWSFEVSDSVGTPAIVGGTAFFAHANGMTAVDLGAETAKWTFRAGANITTCPALADGLVVFGSDDFNIHAVDARTGAEKWKFGTGLIHHPPAVHDGVVYAVSADNLHALDAATGAVKWTVNTQRAGLKAPVVRGDELLVAAGQFLLALDRESGREKWRFEAGGEITSPALSGGVAYFWSEDGHLYAVR